MPAILFVESRAWPAPTDRDWKVAPTIGGEVLFLLMESFQDDE
jgi:hypothetical protein